MLVLSIIEKSLTLCEFATHDRPFVQMLDKTLKKCGVSTKLTLEERLWETILTTAKFK